MINSFKKNLTTFFFKWRVAFFLLILTGSFSSCITSKTSSYFKNINNDTIIASANIVPDELKIQKGDILNLIVSSLNKDEDILYSSSASLPGYEVDNDGEIHVHHIGKINVLGLTRRQLKRKLEEDLKQYLKDPIVNVTFKNHHITILGTVGNPQILPMPAEKMSIIDVLASSGSVAPMSDLSNVVIIRDSSDTKKQVKQINLEDNSVFNSDYFYLNPNDVVVVKPDEKALKRDQRKLQYQQVSSIVLQLLTITIIIYQTFFRN
ncbi:MAG: polysaccharide biosynthesis/export family protein [Bacteroidota bacterium]